MSKLVCFLFLQCLHGFNVEKERRKHNLLFFSTFFIELLCILSECSIDVF